jgi:uncharacterized protein (TIGR03437 family)
VLYGIGFGPVTPSIPAGQIAQQLNALSPPVQVQVGGKIGADQSVPLFFLRVRYAANSTPS